VIRFFALSILVGCAAPVFAETINVPADASSISAAVSRAQDGDVIRVAPGTYRESLVLGERQLTLEADGVTLDADGHKVGILIEGPGNPTLIGLRVTGSNDGISGRGPFRAQRITIADTGDGLDLESGGEAVIVDSIFENNSDDGIDLDKRSSLTLERSIVRNNGDDGIEIRLHDTDHEQTLATVISSSLITGNEGDGIQLINYDDATDRTFVVQDTVFRDNGGAAIGTVADGSSRQVYQGDALEESVVISRNLVIGHRAGVVGGDNMQIEGNVFLDNERTFIRVAGESSIDANAYGGAGSGEAIQQDANAISTEVAAITVLDGAGTYVQAAINTLNQGAAIALPTALPVDESPATPVVDEPDEQVNEEADEGAAEEEQAPVIAVPDTDHEGSGPGEQSEPAEAGTLAIRLSSSLDDVEEESDGKVRAASSDLELVEDDSSQLVGLRFRSVDLPTDAEIVSAHIQFEADSSDDRRTDLRIFAHASDNAPPFVAEDFNVSSRPATAAMVNWSPGEWRKSASGAQQRSPDISLVIQEIVSRPGWSIGNSLALLIDGSGRRTAESVDGERDSAAQLLVEYRTTQSGSEPSSSLVPTVDVSLPGTRPEVSLVAPGALEQSVQAGTAVTFEARTVDKTGKDLSSSQVWISNIDGEIGAGGGIVAAGLSVGSHQIYMHTADPVSGLSPAYLELTVHVVEPVLGGAVKETDGSEAEHLLSGVPEVDRRFVDADRGSDDANGTIAAPWQTLSYAFGQLQPGQTLFIRGGVYNETRLKLDARGEPDRLITIRNFPDEVVTIDASEPTFRVAGAWELVDGSTELYRSVETGFSDDVYIGKVHLPDGKSFMLVPYWNDEGRAHGLADLQSQVYTTSRGPRYVGPGIFSDNGRLYVRLQSLPNDALHGRSVFPDMPTNPNEVALHVSARSNVIEVTGTYLSLHGLTLVGAKSGVELERESSHIQLSNMVFNVAGGAVRMRDGINDISLYNSLIKGGFPPWVAWTDMKGSDGQSRPASYSHFKVSGGGGDQLQRISIVGNTYENVFDGSVINGSGLRFTDNVGVFIDDMVQLGSNSSSVEIARNMVTGAGPSHNGKGNSEHPGTTYVHHNVIDSTYEILWGKQDPEGLLRENYRGWHGHRPFPDHSDDKLDDGNPWKIYHNTVVFDGTTSSAGSGVQLWDNRNDTGVAHEVYNNILVEIGGGRFVRELDAGVGPQVYDGNVYWRAGPPGEVMLDDTSAASGGDQDYATLEAFRASRAFTDSMRWYSPGWEASGTSADPELDEQWYPSASGSAATGAVPLPDGFPGDRHSYRGALAPR